MSAAASSPRTEMTCLFAGGPLRDLLNGVASRAAQALAATPLEVLLKVGEAAVTEQLISRTIIEVPSLERGKAWIEPPVEVPEADRVYIGKQPHGAVTRFTLVVPVTGELRLLGLTPSRFPPGALLGAMDQGESTLRLHCDNPADAAQARAHFERTLDQVEQRLEWTRADIQAHNQQMARQIPAEVARRRAKLLKDQCLHASIGYPIMRRSDAGTYTVPLQRKTITLGRPARPAGRPNTYVPEPAIDDADYEEVLAVLKNARNALERSPSMTSKLDEPQIRDLLLVSLNAQFEGKAAGEVFNGAGKTDILVREGDRNVFIAECKIYDPNDRQKKGLDFTVTGGLNQLLGYLTWRDTKAALLLFIRDTDVSNAIDKAVAAIGRHPNHVRAGKTRTEERHDFVLHANGDTNREIRLAFLPFLIAGKST